MNTNRLFELYAQYIWPVVRKFVRLSKRCTRCIVSEKYSPLVDGVCQECREYVAGNEESSLEVSPETRTRFEKTIRSHVSANPYDALLLLSGGKDSAYILHRLRTEYPDLKILCLTVNNGFMSPVAAKNAQLAAEKTKSDLMIANACVDEFAQALRQAFLDLNGRGSYGVIDHTDGSLIYQTGYRIAAKLRIPLVIGGLSWVQVQRILGKDDFELIEESGLKVIFPLAVWRTNEQEIRKTVRDLELMHPGTDSPIVSNNSLIMAMSVIDVMNLGYSSFEPEFGQLVRENKTDRKTWLHVFELLEFATRKGYLNRDLNRGLSQLGLKLSDVVREEK